MIRRKSKSTKKRGSRTCGWGTGKKHRGKGSRGGCGHGGIGKRGGQKVTFYKAQGIVTVGKVGFKNKRERPAVNAISIKNLEQHLDAWVAKKLADKKGEVYHVDLSKVGYDKIISGGQVTKKMEITCGAIAASAKESIESAGGKVNLPEESKSVE